MRKQDVGQGKFSLYKNWFRSGRLCLILDEGAHQITSNEILPLSVTIKSGNYRRQKDRSGRSRAHDGLWRSSCLFLGFFQFLPCFKGSQRSTGTNYSVTLSPHWCPIDCANRMNEFDTPNLDSDDQHQMFLQQILHLGGTIDMSIVSHSPQEEHGFSE